MNPTEYAREFEKIALEHILSADDTPGKLQRGLMNALIVGGGVGLGAGAGTLAANMMKKDMPALIKSPLFPAVAGLTAAGLNWLYNMREDHKEKLINPEPKQVLVRVPNQDEHARVRELLLKMRPKRNSHDVFMSTKSPDKKFDKEVVLSEGASARHIGDAIWGTPKTASTTYPPPSSALRDAAMYALFFGAPGVSSGMLAGTSSNSPGNAALTGGLLGATLTGGLVAPLPHGSNAAALRHVGLGILTGGVLGAGTGYAVNRVTG